MSHHNNVIATLACAICFPLQVVADSFRIPAQTMSSSTLVINGSEDVGEVELGASISTTSDFEQGITTTGSGNTITNNGTVNTAGHNANAIASTGSRVSIVNNGSVITHGDGSRGIVTTRNDAAITNTGTVYTTGFGSFGVESLETDAKITNKGNIKTEGQSAYGIVSGANNVVIFNEGLVSTNGFSARAILSLGQQHALIVNNGAVKTTNQGSHGIENSASDSKLINNGSVITLGHSALGIATYGENNTLTNNGMVTTSGDFADAIVIGGANSIVNNYGRISATGVASYAILGGSGKQTLNIMPGSQISGRINLEGVGDADEVNFYGSNGSALITIESGEIIRIQNSNATLIGNKIIYIDPTINAFARHSLHSMTNVVHSSVEHRLSGVSSSTRASSQETVNQVKLSQGEGIIWANTFGQKNQRDASEHSQAYGGSLAGVTIGLERTADVNTLGFMGGVATSDTSSSSNRRQSDSFFLGIYSRHIANATQFNLSLLFGSREHQLQRQQLDNLDGVITSFGRTAGSFISPSLKISNSNTILSYFDIQPSATITYSFERIRGFNETGASNNIQHSTHKIEALSTRLQLESTKTVRTSVFNVRMGVNSRNTRSRDLAYRLNGTELAINPNSNDNAIGLFAGIQADIQLRGSLRLRLLAEYGKLGRSEKFSNGSLVAYVPF